VQSQHAARLAAAKGVSLNDPAFAAHPVAQANAASWPTGKGSPRAAKAPPSVAGAPGAGSVTERIFAACDAEWAALRAADPGKWGSPAALPEARKLAIPKLEAAGVNINSARKGSSMWLQARLASP
jgi:hypothetical protein